MPRLNDHERVVHLTRKLGPHAARFAEYASGELWKKIHDTARAMGLTPLEAEVVAALVVKNTVAALAGSLEQVRRDRGVSSGRG